MKLWPAVLSAIAVTAVLAVLGYFLSDHSGGSPTLLKPEAWQHMARPGALSQAHAFLENDCAACHTAVKGPEGSNCIACHANNQALLASQTTAFHANISDCRGCHIEHQGVNQRPIAMNHSVLFKQGRARVPAAEGESLERVSVEHPRISQQEAALRCATCHANQDPHRSLFGADCASCHATVVWTIPEFRHPSPRSTDCAQCHQAPPSHYMEHFSMVSMRVAGIEHAQVSQCFVCHKTNAWNDIKNVGWYKHH
ncbi:MAG TPA: cytochrome c3 family protein [Noviherbaspirillum sp.]